MASSKANTWLRKMVDVASLSRIKLNNLQDLPGAKKKAIRVGRGPGSGRGKTCGRGHKGQGQRNRKRVRVGFEGGQTPFYLRVPKRGFVNIFRKEYEPLNLSTLQHFINIGGLDHSQPINMRTLHRAGAVGRIKHGVKLLAGGADTFTSKVDIEVSQASQKAIEAVEKQGGRIVTAYYNRLGLKVLLKPERFEGKEVPRRALPNKKLMAYYLNPAHRGYLLTEAGQHRLAEGGIAGAYLDPDGYVALPGKRTTLYSQPAPTREEAYQELQSPSGTEKAAEYNAQDATETDTTKDLGTPV